MKLNFSPIIALLGLVVIGRSPFALGATLSGDYIPTKVDCVSNIDLGTVVRVDAGSQLFEIATVTQYQDTPASPPRPILLNPYDLQVGQNTINYEGTFAAASGVYNPDFSTFTYVETLIASNTLNYHLDAVRTGADLVITSWSRLDPTPQTCRLTAVPSSDFERR